MIRRHLTLTSGTEITPTGVRFRLWAPGVTEVSLELDGQGALPMSTGGGGWFELTVAEAGAGSRYRYVIGDLKVPDPASRWQPDAADGPSGVIDPRAFEWQLDDFEPPAWEDTVLYELHVGSFTPQGDFDGVIERLGDLQSLGINAIELMPVAECPGRWNWGYDGVLPYAVAKRYGGPEGLKRLVEACHARGMAVVLDVVYNHFGPQGNYLHAYAPQFFTERHQTPWGAAVNLDDVGAPTVRNFFIENALYWLQEYGIDGLRFDAVHAFKDDSHPDFVQELGERIRAALPERRIHLVLENDHNRSDVLGFGSGGPGPFNAQWNDDFHHALRVLTTDAQGGYYRDYSDDPARHLARLLASGFAYQGRSSIHRGGAVRGQDSSALSPAAFVAFNQNHDQVGNHAFGWRLPKFASDEAMRASTAILLLSPQIPLLWMGQEWACDQPFPFFCDFDGELADAVRKGRREEFSSFPEFSDPDSLAAIPDPLAEETFRSAILDWSRREQPRHAAWLEFTRELIALRRAHLMPRLRGIGPQSGQAAPNHGRRVDVRWQLGDGSQWRLLANLGPGEEPAPDDGGNDLAIYGPTQPGEVLPPWFVRFSLLEALA